MKKLLGVGALIVALAGAVLAQGSTWAWIMPETFVCVFGPPCPGTTQPLIEDVPVPQQYQGLTCEVFATTQNNASVHPGNDVEIASGGQSVFMFDVEGQPFATTYAADGSLTLADTVSMYVHMGSAGLWSAELDMQFICLDGGPTATPTNTPTVTATQPGPTATPTSTSTAAPTATATQPGPTFTPTSTPGPTSVQVSTFRGNSDGVRNTGMAVGLALIIALLVFSSIKRRGE